MKLTRRGFIAGLVSTAVAPKPVVLTYDYVSLYPLSYFAGAGATARAILLKKCMNSMYGKMGRQ